MKIGRLQVLSGPHDGKRVFLLEKLSVFELGRAAGSHVKIRDEAVAMNHARIFRSGEEFTLYALSEQKPTMVNGTQVKKVVLKHGDRIALGATEFLFELLTPEEARRPLAETTPLDVARGPSTGSPDAAAARADRGAHSPEPVPAAPASPPAGEASQPRTPARLIVVDGQNRGAVYPLTGKEKFKVGRSSTNDIRLPDVKVSRDHCVIEQLEGHYIVVDLESANGTVVNGERIRKTVLQDNDFLRLGFTVLKFEAAK